MKNSSTVVSARRRLIAGWARLYLPVFSIALLLRLFYLVFNWSILPDWNVDAIGYHQLAINVIERGVFSLNSQPPYQPDAIRTPGYPIFMGMIYHLVGIAPRAVLVAQAVLDSFTALLIMGISLELIGSNRAATIAGMLYAIYPVAWRYCAELYVEIVLAFLITLVFFILSRTWKARSTSKAGNVLSLGLAVALSLLVKPNVALLPIIVGAVLLVKGTLRQAAVYAITLIILLMPWIARNTLIFGRPMLSTVFENNLARVSAPATLAEARGEKVAPWTPRWEELFLEVVDVAANENPALFAIPLNDLTPPQLYQTQLELAGAARGIIATQPLVFAISHVKGVLRGLLPQEYRFWFMRISGQTWESILPRGIVDQLLTKGWPGVPALALGLFLFFAIPYLFGFVAALLGAWRLLRSNPVMGLAMIALILYAIVLPGPIAYVRFRIPIMPLVYVLIAVAVAHIGRATPGHLKYVAILPLGDVI